MKNKNAMRLKRKLSIRRKVHGTSIRPRLAVFRSNTRISAQLIDDDKASTIVSCAVLGKNIASAIELGHIVIEKAKAKKITAVVFDRSGYRYHGAIKAVCETVREGGIHV